MDNLRAHPKNRPSNRQALERPIATLSGSTKPADKATAALIAALEHDGIVTIADKRSGYTISKTTK